MARLVTPGVVGAVVRRPDLWLTALRQWRRLTPRRWWARPPFLPLPDRRWMAFRLTTAYGRADVTPPSADAVGWLEWCRAIDRA